MAAMVNHTHNWFYNRSKKTHKQGSAYPDLLELYDMVPLKMAHSTKLVVIKWVRAVMRKGQITMYLPLPTTVAVDGSILSCILTLNGFLPAKRSLQYSTFYHRNGFVK